MTVFRDFEIKALHLLLRPDLDETAVDIIICEAEFVSYAYSGCGYFLLVKHPSLPKNRIVCSEPQVIGRAGSVQSGFLAFIENGELMLECYTLLIKEHSRDHNDDSDNN